MAARSKLKGSSFERLVAASILEAVGKEFTKKDCYRTPMSGGHPYAGESDLVVSKRLRQYLPFVIECKHRKTWRETHVFQMSGDVKSFIKQVQKAADKDKFHRAPLLIIRGVKRTYAMSPDFSEWLGTVGLDLETTNRLIVSDPIGTEWIMIQFSSFLQLLGKVVGRKKVE